MQTRVSNYPHFKGCALVRRITKVVLSVSAVAAVGGCTHWDSFLNPSVVGYWENTPSSVPILERIAMIEDEADQPVSFSPITPSDLMPEPDEYKLASGDGIVITVYDLVTQGVPQTELRVIDQAGYIEYPQLGRFYVHGLSEDELRRAIEDRAREFIDDPLVSVTVQQRRMQAFHLYGNVRAPGPYMIPSADYRLLEALIAAGGIGETMRYVHVIRQVPLSQDIRRRSPAPSGSPQVPPPSGDDLLDMIDDLSGRGSALPTRPAETLPGLAQATQDGARAPIVDLPDAARERRDPMVEIDGGAPSGLAGSRWVFLNGEWVMTSGMVRSPTASSVNGGDPYLEAAGTLVTQRVIRVPVKPLLSGDARFNIVVRPGDIIRVPLPEQGNIYIDGQVNRPGVFILPSVGRLTLTRAITAAGGLGGLAIPERVDLTRVVGENQQATIMLNLRAIAQGTQPDVYLKPDDRINVGTNFWAYPLAVFRNGFRVSYGFGFLLDRNFGNDVFGPPPTNRAGF